MRCVIVKLAFLVLRIDLAFSLNAFASFAIFKNQNIDQSFYKRLLIQSYTGVNKMVCLNKCVYDKNCALAVLIGRFQCELYNLNVETVQIPLVFSNIRVESSNVYLKRNYDPNASNFNSKNLSMQIK